MRTKLIVWSLLFAGALGICLVFLLNRDIGPTIDYYEATDGDGFRARLSDNSTYPLRYVSINAPGKAQTLGRTAFELNSKLIQEAQAANTLLVTPRSTDTSDCIEDLYGRPLVRVFLKGEENPEHSIETALVSKGLALLDVRDPTDVRIQKGEDFAVRYADAVIAAQIEAAMERQGWWGEADEHVVSDVIVAAIRYWSADEVVYIINRGNQSISLSEGWRLTDDGINFVLNFEDFPHFQLLPQGVLRIHSAFEAKAREGELVRTQSGIDLYWLGRNVWNQDADKASLWDANGVQVYLYSYPLKDDYWK